MNSLVNIAKRLFGLDKSKEENVLKEEKVPVKFEPLGRAIAIPDKSEEE